jgi:hypothetical protein
MKKEITLGQLVGVATSLMVAVFGAWLSLNVRVAKLEESKEQNKANIERIESKLDRVLFYLMKDANK